MRRAVLLVAALVAAGCSVQVHVGSAKEKPEGHRMKSSTPHLAAVDDVNGEDLLLTTADLRAIDGLPDDLVVTSVDSTEVYENPDPRGMCGAVAEPTPTGGAARGLQGESAVGFENAEMIGAARAAAYLASMRADMHPGCPEWSSRTNTGSTQHGTYLGEVALPDVGDDRLAVQLEIANEGQTLNVIQVVLQQGDTLVDLFLLTLDRLDEAAVVGLAERLGDRLDR